VTARAASRFHVVTLLSTLAGALLILLIIVTKAGQ
jgi:hypothetical protein